MASLRRAGHNVAPASRPFEVCADAPDGVLFAASYVDRDGRAVGFCIAAHASDEAGLQAARETVNSWSAVWRTRRAVVASTSPACHDDERHGCHHLMTARAEMRVFAERGDQIVVVGQRGHPTLAALLDDLAADVVVIDSDDHISHQRLDPDRVSYVVQPGMLIEDAARVIATLRALYPRVRGAHPDGLCYAASDRAATISAVAASCDATFILGEVTHPDILSPFRLAAAEETQVHVIDDIAQIRPAWIAGAASIGIVPTTSASPSLEHDLLDLLSGLGPLSIARRRLTTDVLTSWHGHCVTTPLSQCIE
ncbi:hypothetical protein SK571_29570 [Lentzea sp. BCCO 10_0798]|uniref:Xanthine dehydrogenase accessory factor n=1 Tax=Lentzea kristufekii TaxID=3095430 RepID=A0ABU4TZ02_9PSEU|nr:hypothetical protein [Lentzea sp. BCCO 10_0798]MDX8053541.1 hypothetical protein [Lentzea sp. BCCO 10_0798]